ncbi:MAG: hypothetical protein M1819_001504 [Sarea resinae]|nr:MAG: hypothetical protein M1819_001504 [Sarea resinae]
MHRRRLATIIEIESDGVEHQNTRTPENQIIATSYRTTSSSEKGHLETVRHVRDDPNHREKRILGEAIMNAVDGSEHYERESNEPPPSLLTVILDTNPHAWSLLSSTLPLSKAIANILVFINAHLAFNYANKVAVIASHSQRAQFLYPSPPSASTSLDHHDAPQLPASATGQEDTEMADAPPKPKLKLTLNGRKPTPSSASPAAEAGQARTTDDANKYLPFRLVEEEVMSNLRALIASTTASDISTTNSTQMAGALTLALSYTNKQALAYTESNGGSAGATGDRGGNDGREPEKAKQLQSRILVLSVSGDLAFQYIPVMNCIFAAQRQRIPIDILKIAGDTVFLQQASDATRGIYLPLDPRQGLLQYLMMAYLPSPLTRQHLIPPTQVNVDFRAACFCHKRVVDVGYVCSICLSIFCQPPAAGECLTCGTLLGVADYGRRAAVVARKKKKKRRLDGAGGTGGTPTPTPGGTPLP